MVRTSLKILVLGEPGVGKTSYITRSTQNIFSKHHKSTIGVDYKTKDVDFHNGDAVTLQLWDIAGQDRFRSVCRVFYKDAVGVILVYDISRPETRAHFPAWKKEIDSKVLLSNGKPVPVIIVANKGDLDVDIEQESNIGKALAERYGFLGWICVSAAQGTEIENPEITLVTEILKNIQILKLRENPIPKHLKKDDKDMLSSCF